jgi:Uma2 family endonuclease
MSLVVQTYEDLCRLPEDDLRHEIIRGEHVVTPSPRVVHQMMVTRLILELGRVLGIRGTVFAPSPDIRFAGEDVLVPDLIFVSRSFTMQSPERYLSGGPDLVVEVLSPGTAARDRTVKREIYEAGGVKEYWIVDIDAGTIEVYRAQTSGTFGPVTLLSCDREETLTSPLFPGLDLPLSRLFA